MNGSGHGELAFFVRDDGTGVEIAYAEKPFGAFQRLQGADQFESVGIGLAAVPRIVHHHGGGSGRSRAGHGRLIHAAGGG